MKKIIPLIFSVFYITFSNGQAVGGWGNCEFATVATMNAFDPSTNAYDCKKVFVQATDEHYYWDGTNWVLVQDTDDQTASEVNITDVGGNFTATNVEDALAELATTTDDNIYNTDGTLDGNREVALDGNDLTFKGTNDVFIESTGNVGIGTNSPDEELEVIGDAEITQHLYVGPNAGTSINTTLRVREDFNTNTNTTYQYFSNPTITSPLLTADRTSYGIYQSLINNKTEDIAGGFDSDAVGGAFRTYSSGTNTFRNLYGVQGYAYNQSTAAANVGNLYGGYFQAYNNANTATIPNAFASYNYVRTVNSRDGDITNAYGSYNRVRVDSDDGGDIAIARAGHFLTDRRGGANLITTAYGISIDVNDAVTAYGLRVDADDVDPTTNYGIYIDAVNATTDNYGIFGERGDWVLDQDGDGTSGGTGSGGDLVLGESQDLELYHDGTNSNIINNTGDLNITSATSNDVHISTNGGKVGVGNTAPSAKLEVTYDRGSGFAPNADDGQNAYLSSIVGYNNNASAWSRTITGLTPNIPDGSVSGLFTFGQGDSERQSGHMYFVDTGADGDEYVGFAIRSGAWDILNLTGDGDVGIGTNSPDAKLDVENGTVRFSDYGAGTNTGTETYMLGVDTDGDVIEMNTAKSAKIFYPPAIAVIADAIDTDLTIDLHQQYVTLFGSPAVKSSSAPAAIPTYGETELYYYITDYDTDIFENVTIGDNGIMEYDVKAVPSDNCSFINVVFVVK